MNRHLYSLLLGVIISGTWWPHVVLAGFDEGKAAYQKGDYKTALSEFRTAADQGNADAQSIIAIMYLMGQGVPQDYKVALKLLRLAADQGSVEAQAVIGVMYANGEGVPQDYKEALKWSRPAADQGNADAQSTISMMYFTGQGVPQDYKEAVKWSRLAADQGSSEAQYNLGVMYCEGKGVTQDYKEAVKWHRLAADKGNTNAQNNLGVMYANGQGVPQDYKEAMKWYRLAANQGNAGGQFNLGAMFHDGNGVPQDWIAAYALFNLSASIDPSEKNPSTALRNKLSSSMTTMQIEVAQNLTREMSAQGNVLKALDRYLNSPSARVASKHNVARKPENAIPTTVPSSDPFPVRPAKRPGLVSCNTRCMNADCWRTYDDGQKVGFQAKRKYDGLSGEWKFDSGGC